MHTPRSTRSLALAFVLGALLVGGVLGFTADRVLGRDDACSRYFTRSELRKRFADRLELTPVQRVKIDSILDAKREYPSLTARELTRICWARCGHRPSPHTVKRVLAESPPPPRKHPNASRNVIWVQEEPANMGPLSFVQRRIERLIARPIRSIKRSASGSPATGSKAVHDQE